MKKESLHILYEDDDIVAINKQAGILTIPDRFRAELPNLRDILKEKYGEIFVVHRLDKETTGVILFAKNAEAHRHLSLQFEHNTIEKIYHTVVGGVFDKENLDIDIPLAPDPRRKGLMKPNALGKESLTHVEVVERFKIATLLACTPKTGRQHQIRVHLSAIGYPLLVDADYGKQKEFKLSTIKRRYNLAKDTDEKPIISTTTLHAQQIRFIHPTTEKKMMVTAEYPKSFAALLQVLRKYSHYVEFSFEDFKDW